MTWSPSVPKNDEASKVRYELVPYMHGRAYDLGCGAYKVFPHFVGVDNGKEWGRAWSNIHVESCEKLELFASNVADCVFSSHLLEHIEYEKVPATLKEWARIIKPGGHLILYLPDEDSYPKVGETGANVDHKWNVSFDKVLKAMSHVERGWSLIDFQKRNQGDEYSLFFVFKMDGKGHRITYTDAKPAKTCAIVRLGAIGDQIQTSSILPWLKEQGYHITMYVQDNAGYEVIKHDPHVDRFIIQGHNEVPPELLQEFWDYTRKKYDKWVNLSESIEGTLLASSGRPNFDWPNAARAAHMDRNYLEWIHQLAEVPLPFRQKFYSTQDERAWARKKASLWGSKNILWSLAGSSGHKVWPHLDAMIARIMLAYRDVHVVLVGDELCQILEVGWQKEPRVHCVSGKWSIRESLSFAEFSDLVIGCDTGVLNAVGLSDVPKIITLSHSSEEMLTKHWVNTIALKQPEGVGCPKSPCRQLHHNWEHCPKHEETGTSLCQYHIGPEVMWDAIQSVLGVNERMVA